VAVLDLPWDQVGRPMRRQWERGNADPDDTDLARLVRATRTAAETLGIPAMPAPWTPPLPRILARPPAPLAYGLVDVPQQQKQFPLSYDLAAGRRLLVIGSPGSGRTTLLRTLAATLATSTDPADLWLYVLDGGGGELRALAELPHVGAVVTRFETDRAGRLLRRLQAEVVRRLDRLAGAGLASVTEQRGTAAPAQRLPYICLLLDRWEGFLATFGSVDNGQLRETVERLAEEGGPAGLRLVVTGDRSLLTGRLSRAIEDRLLLALADRADLVLAGLNPRDLPAEMPPGRAVRPADRAEVQIALLDADPSGPAQAGALARVIASVAGPAGSAFRVDPLPERVDLAAAQRLPGWCPGRLWGLVGVGGDELGVLGIDLARHDPGFVVAGPRQSGRSTALLVLAHSLLAGGNAVLVFAPRESPLRNLAGQPGVVAVLAGREPPAERVVALLNETPGPLAVIVDDAPELVHTVVGDLLDQQVREGPEKGHTLMVSGVVDDLRRPMHGFIPRLRQARSGLLLCPQSYLDGDVLGVELPRSAAFRRPVGRGILVLDNELTLVQVPQPE
jgi:S-DNA-T family DNA segregation ATPase FtsK/SpoIIIE